MLSTDIRIFDEKGAVRDRILEYGKLVDELQVIVYTRKKPKLSSWYSGNISVRPTNSRARWRYFFDVQRIAKDILSKDGGWLISAQDPFETALAGYLLKRRFRAKFQIQAHTDFLSPHFAKESLKNKIRVLLGKFLIKKADGLRVVSERIKESLAASKAAVLPIYTDLTEIRKAIPNEDLHKIYPGRFVILMVARLAREKNIPLAIEAMGELVRKHPGALLVIVGKGPERKKLENLIQRKGLEDYITIREIERAALLSWYKTADLFLLTSNYEGYGLAPVEAAAAGLPVIMTKVGVEIGDTVPVGDKERLAEVLEELVSSQSKRQELIQRQSKFFENWPTKKEYLNKMKELWQNCY